MEITPIPALRNIQILPVNKGDNLIPWSRPIFQAKRLEEKRSVD